MSKMSDPANRWIAINNTGESITETIRNADGTVLPIRGIVIAETGTIELEDSNGNALYFSNLSAGVYPLRPNASTSNTTATLYALYGN